jgi:bifunctional UDP-N-acetylglucosamine pyrophosphorylase/glucosamine-1-phosphate N-acetyltransferase
MISESKAKTMNGHLMEDAPQAIIMAAGKGTRLGGDKPKVAYQVADRPIIQWVVEACREAGVSRCVVIIGHRGEEVRKILEHQHDCIFVEQAKQLGTGHAVQMARQVFANTAPADVFVLAGDAPLIRPSTLETLLKTHRQSKAAATLATAVLDNPEGYGRIVRKPDGSFQAIVEQRDASPEQKLIREINSSYYCFRSNLLFQALDMITPSNAQGEYYLTDAPRLLKESGQGVVLVDAVPPEDVLGVNTIEQLRQVDQLLRARLIHRPSSTGEKQIAC